MNTIEQIFKFLIDLMQNLVVLLIGLALLGFLIGILKYFTAGGSQDKRRKSIDFMTYGLISLLVMVSVWGFVYFLGNTLGIKLKQNNGNFLNNLESNNSREGDRLNPLLRNDGDSPFLYTPGDDEVSNPDIRRDFENQRNDNPRFLNFLRNLNN